MLNKDFKKFGLLISTSLTGTFEALVNLIPRPAYRQIFNPLSILCSICITVYILHKIKCYAKDLQIKNYEDEISALSKSEVDTDIRNKIRKCHVEIIKLKREKSIIEFF